MSEKMKEPRKVTTLVRAGKVGWIVLNIVLLGIPWLITKAPKPIRLGVWIAINIPLLGIPAIMLGGPRRLWDEFFSYAIGTYKEDKETGEILWIRFTAYPDWIHFHWMVWGGLTLAATQPLPRAFARLGG